MSEIDILNLEWSSNGRDQAIVIPVLQYLNLKYGYSFKSESIFAGEYFLLKYRPRVLLISNTVGAIQNVKIASFAKKIGVKVISMISEGNVNENQIEQMTWGWKTERQILEDLIILWSERSRQLMLKYFPNLTPFLRVSGATGFDRYKLLQFMMKEEYLKILGAESKYNGVIGYAVWGFDWFFHDQKAVELSKLYSSENINKFKEDRNRVNNILKVVVESNPDKLFLIRYHPATLCTEETEVAGLEIYPNVKYISGRGDIKIEDNINVTDIWLSYNSTTAIEAWLLNKPTYFINPNPEFVEGDRIILGAPVGRNEEEAVKAIATFYNSGCLAGFDEIREVRSSIISDIIESDDGLNHQRAANIIHEFIAGCASKNLNFDLLDFLRSIKSLFLVKGSPILALANNSRYGYIYEKLKLFNRDELKIVSEIYRESLIKLHKFKS